jgi:hypothetical protein
MDTMATISFQGRPWAVKLDLCLTCEVPQLALALTSHRGSSDGYVVLDSCNTQRTLYTAWSVRVGLLIADIYCAS